MDAEWLDGFMRGLAQVLVYLQNNPIVVVALIAGGVAIVIARIALRGVRMSLATAAEDTKRQLDQASAQDHRNREFYRVEADKDRKHDADQNRHARLMEARREVYLAVIGEFVKFQSMLGTLGGLDLARAHPEGLVSGLTVAVQRVAIVAEQATVAQVREAFGMCMKVFQSCLAFVVPITRLQAAVATLESLRSQESARGTEAIEAMRQLNLAAQPDPDAFGLLQRQSNASQGQLDELRVKIETETARLIAAQAEFAQFVTAEIAEQISGKLDAVLAALRAELELSTDLRALRAQSVEMEGAAGEALAGLRRALMEGAP